MVATSPCILICAESGLSLTAEAGGKQKFDSMLVGGRFTHDEYRPERAVIGLVGPPCACLACAQRPASAGALQRTWRFSEIRASASGATLMRPRPTGGVLPRMAKLVMRVFDRGFGHPWGWLAGWAARSWQRSMPSRKSGLSNRPDWVPVRRSSWSGTDQVWACGSPLRPSSRRGGY